jgi:hypothetical protein
MVDGVLLIYNHLLEKQHSLRWLFDVLTWFGAYSLNSINISKKPTFNYFIIQSTSGLKWSKIIWCTSKGSKMWEIWWLPIPNFIWSLTIHYLCSMPILKIYSCQYNFTPIWFWQICMVEHLKNYFKQSSILLFNTPIWFRQICMVEHLKNYFKQSSILLFDTPFCSKE